jgi:surface antigen
MQTDGNLVVYAPGGQALWSTGTGGGNWNASAVIQTDGNFVVYAPTGRPLWSWRSGRTGLSGSTLSAGQSLSAGQALWSSDGSYEAIMQTDGNFVVYAAGGKPTWSTGTGTPGSRIAMQGDGNLVVYTPGGQPAWASSTGGADGKLAMQTDSNLVVYFSGVPLWSSNRAHGTTATSNRFVPGNCTWYAAQRWDQATGSYPGFIGNAWQWTANAINSGYTVTATPQPRSVVVFPKTGTSPDGHVAWVDSVARNSDGSISVHIDEMNLQKLYQIDSRTITNTSDLRYVLVPY